MYNDRFMHDPFQKVRAERRQPALRLVVREGTEAEKADPQFPRLSRRPKVAARWLNRRAALARSQGYVVEETDGAISILQAGKQVAHVRIATLRDGDP